METFAERMDRIAREDRVRRAERDYAELMELVGRFAPNAVPKGVDPYHYDRSIKGQPTDRNRNHRASPDNWDNHTYRDASGRITSTPMRATGTDVKVTYADGHTETRSASSFRKTSRGRTISRVSEARQLPESARLAPIDDYSVDA